jgi:hypothetical protein
VFDGFEDDGRIISVHLIVDSAFIELRHDGTYTHAIFHSEWEGPDGGDPTARRFRCATFDFCGWARDGTAPWDLARRRSGARPVRPAVTLSP